VVAEFESGDASADLLDHARSLVAQHDRGGHRRESVRAEQVGVAEAGGRDPHEDLAGPWLIQVDGGQGESVSRCLGERGAYLHASFL
jgi:hypothetical protein